MSTRLEEYWRPRDKETGMIVIAFWINDSLGFGVESVCLPQNLVYSRIPRKLDKVS